MLVRLSRDTITPEVRRIMGELRDPRPVMQAGAKELQVQIVRHLKALESRGNEQGWPSQKFFAGGPNSVDKHVGLAVARAVATVTIADPRFVHHVTGGVVVPKRRRFLAIPLTAAAYSAGGKGSIRESMPWLKLVRGAFDTALGRRAGLFLAHGLEVLFQLVRSVRHRPHPQAMPDLTVIQPRVGAAMARAARLLLRAQR